MGNHIKNVRGANLKICKIYPRREQLTLRPLMMVADRNAISSSSSSSSSSWASSLLVRLLGDVGRLIDVMNYEQKMWCWHLCDKRRSKQQAQQKQHERSDCKREFLVSSPSANLLICVVRRALCTFLCRNCLARAVIPWWKESTCLESFPFT